MIELLRSAEALPSVEPGLSPPEQMFIEETSFEIAVLIHCRDALKAVPNLIAPDDLLSKLARRAKLGRSVAKDPAFAPIVLSMLDKVLPAVPDKAPFRLEVGRQKVNGALAELLYAEGDYEEFEFTSSAVLPKTRHELPSPKQRVIERIALSKALLQSGIVDRDPRTNTYGARRGMFGAASYFRKDMEKDLDVEVYRHKTYIRNQVRGHLERVPLRAMRGRSGTSPTFFQFINTEEDEVTLGSLTATPHVHFWRLLKADLLKLGRGRPKSYKRRG